MVSEKVKSIFVDNLGLNEDEITMDTEIINDLDADSLDIVELSMIIERDFNIDIDEDDLKKLKTIGDVVDYIESKM